MAARMTCQRGTRGAGAGEPAVSGSVARVVGARGDARRRLRAAGAARWGVARGHVWPRRCAGRGRARFGDGAAPVPARATRFVSTLHLADLALACACAEGMREAWDHFVLTFRPELYRAARAIAGDAGSRELADSLYADLFGLPRPRARAGRCCAITTGAASSPPGCAACWRSGTSTRCGRAAASPRSTIPTHATEEAAAPPAPEPERAPRMRAAAEAVSRLIAALEPPDRLRLADHYVHDLTLAQTGRLLARHEATASRKLEHARKALRAGIEAALEPAGCLDRYRRLGRRGTRGLGRRPGDALGVPAPPAVSSGPEGGSRKAWRRTPFKGKRTP